VSHDASFRSLEKRLAQLEVATKSFGVRWERPPNPGILEVDVTVDKKDKIGYSIGFAFCILMGVWAILVPSAMEDYAASEIAGGLKQLFAEFWGRKLGMAMVALGALALIGVHQSE
jgi:hypothetical protein